MIQQIHIMAGSKIMDTFGLMMSKKDHQTVYFTTDSQHCSPAQVEHFYHEADIIFQDCETSEIKSGVHANYNELVTLEDDIKNKMWLYHYNPGKLPDAKADGFKGFVVKGQESDFSK